MRSQIFAGTVGVVLAAITATSAIALERSGAGQSGLHTTRYAGVRGFSEWRHGGWNGHRTVAGRRGLRNSTYYGSGHYRSLGPLGFTLDDGHYSGYGSSIAAWSW